MAIETPQSNAEGRDGGWAAPVAGLHVDDAPEGVATINVDGKKPIGALEGFGQFWQKSYIARLEGVTETPEAIMDAWKAHFADFQPEGNRFYTPKGGVEPGKIMLIDSPLPIYPPRYDKPGVVPMTSGVMILYADEVSFGVMTPEGFPVAGWNNFMVYNDDDGTPTAQILSFERASDPIYEFGFRLMGGANRQEFIWVHVLTQLAAHLGVETEVKRRRELLDPHVQWKYAGRIFQNAGIRTTLYRLAAPARWVSGKLRRQRSAG